MVKYKKTLVCFANSRKTAGRCIAGREWNDGKPGAWIRPVSNRTTHEISEDERRYNDGQEPNVLDIIQLSCIEPQPLPHQSENHIIDLDETWVKQGALSWKEIPSWLDHPPTLWSVGEDSYSGCNNRVVDGKADGGSLYLVSVERLNLLVGLKAPEYPDSKRAVRGEFVYQNVIYRMDVTDPVIERNYLSKADGEYVIYDPVLCVSLGDLYKGHFYKLIAGILYPERFA